MFKPKTPYLLGFFLCLILLPGCFPSNHHTKTPQEYAEKDGIKMVARTAGRYLEVYSESTWHRLPVKGVNIGTALPGRWFTEFPANKRIYLEWFEQIANMNANTIRVYTLLDPTFYEALYEFNMRPGGPRLWLLQEIWPDEDVPDGNLYQNTYVENYRQEIARVIDAIHGCADIPERAGRAWGTYCANVSPYLLGLMVGRELLPEEVHSTNEANPEKKEYNGNFIRAGNASASEVWLAAMCDFAVSYSVDKYRWQMPVAFVSWPTLDPLKHTTSYMQGKNPDDAEEINPAHLFPGPKSLGGLFGAYHIYPNYPDFIYRDTRYAGYTDEQGVFRYGGYLKHFMEVHPPYPALVAEFGMSTSLNTAHMHPEGLHHGGVSEKQQGEMIARMMKTIMKEGYAGGIIFQWADEWAKKTWITEPFMIPYERHVYWHNAMDPEQNYGILACEPPFHPLGSEFDLVWQADHNDQNIISALYAKEDAAYLYLMVELTGQRGLELFAKEKELALSIAIDTFGRQNGSNRLPLQGLPALPSGAEFLLQISGSGGARLLARPDYNRSVPKFMSNPGKDPSFIPVRPLVNRRQVSLQDGTIYPEIYADESKLHYGNFDPASTDYDSLSHWFVDDSGQRLYIRLPWLLLNVGDPSSHLVLYDQRPVIPQKDNRIERNQIGFKKTEGFLFYVVVTNDGKLLDYQPRAGEDFKTGISPYLWLGWDTPSYRTRLKQGYQQVAETFGSIK